MSAPKYKATIIGFSVHLENENPLFGESAIHVMVQDDAGGAFLKLVSTAEDVDRGEVKLDFDQLKVICEIAGQLDYGEGND